VRGDNHVINLIVSD